MKKLLFVLSLAFSGMVYGQCVEGDCVNGKGKFVMGKDTYIGEFKDDEFNGQGIYTYGNGDKYEGGL